MHDGGRGRASGRRRAVRRARPVAVRAVLLDAGRGTATGDVRGGPPAHRQHGVVLVVIRGRRVHFVRGHHVQQLWPTVHNGRVADRGQL